MISKIFVYVLLYLGIRAIIRAGLPEKYEESDSFRGMAREKKTSREATGSYYKSYVDTASASNQSSRGSPTYDYFDTLEEMNRTAEEIALMEIACQQDREEKAAHEAYLAANDPWFHDSDCGRGDYWCDGGDGWYDDYW